MKPTVLTNVNNSMRVAQEEIFGPVVTAIPFKDEEDVIRQANKTIYGLSAGVWTTRRFQSASHFTCVASRNGVGQLLQPTRSDFAVWWLQAEWLWP